MRPFPAGAALFVLALALGLTVPPGPDLPARIKELTRTTLWTRTAAIPVLFDTFHPQVMVRIGDTFIVSSVDKQKGEGHLFKIGADGRLITDLRLDDDERYHPGGIDYDGKDIWVP